MAEETFNIKLGMDADNASIKATASEISANLQKYLDERLSSNLKFRSFNQVLHQSLNYALEESAKRLDYKGSLSEIHQGISNALAHATTSNVKNLQTNLQHQVNALSVKLKEAMLSAQKAGASGAPNVFAKMQGRVIEMTKSLDYMRTVLDTVDFNKVATGDETALDLNAIADAFTRIEERAKRAETTMLEARSLMQDASQLGISSYVDTNDMESSSAKLKADVEERKKELAEEAQLRAQEAAEMQRQRELSRALLDEQSRMTQLIADAWHSHGRLQAEQEHLINMGERDSARYEEIIKEKAAWKEIIETIREYREEIKEMQADAQSGNLLDQKWYKNVSTTTGKLTADIPDLKTTMEKQYDRQVSNSMLSRIRDALSGKGQQEDLLANETEEVRALITELNTAKETLNQLLAVGGSPTAIVETQTQIQQLEQSIARARAGTQEMEQQIVSFPSTFGTANWGKEIASGMQSASTAMDKTEKEADEVSDAIKLIKNAGTECASVLRELGVTASEAGDKGEQGANKAKTAHQNFQSTLGSVRYALSAIGINSSSMLGKMITLVGLLEDAFRGAGSAAQSIIPILGVFLSIGMSVFGTLIKWARKLLNVIVSIGHKLIEVSTKAVGIAKKAVSGLADKIKGFINFFKPSLAKLKKWLMQWGLGARSPYFVIRKIRTMVIDGMKEIAQYSDSVATSMNNFKTALNSVKGSVVSAFEPVASYVIPILTRLLNLLASVLDSIAKFNATLLGRSTYFKFVAADVNEYGNAVSEAGKASKKAQKDLMGFDEINRLSAPNEGGAGGTGSESTGKYVETAIDTASGISKWAKRIREAWVQPFEESMEDLYDVFWDIGFKIGVNINSGLLKFNSNANNYKQTAMKIAQCLAAAINGIVDTPMLGYNIGAAIANVFNITFSGLHQFATTVHWDKVGKFIGDGIAGALETFDWYQFFDTIVQFINGLADMIYNIAVGHDWGAIGKNIAQSIFNALKNFDAAKAGQAVHEFLGAVLDFINGFVDQMSTKQKVSVHADVDPKTGKLLSGEVISEYKTGWDILADKISDFWDNIGSGELGEKAGNIASGGFFGFFKVLSGGASMMDSVKEFLDGFVKNITNYPWQSAMHDWWNVFYPKLKSFLEWAGPKLAETLKWLWDTISPTVLQIAKDIGTAIGNAIKDAIFTKLGKKITDFFYGEDYEEALQEQASMTTTKHEAENDAYFDKLTDAQRKQLDDYFAQNKDKLPDSQKEAYREYERWKKQTPEQRKEKVNKYNEYYGQPEVNFDNSAVEESSAELRKDVNETAKAYEASSKSITLSNTQVSTSGQQTASAVGLSASKIQMSNQKSQQSFATTATSSATMSSAVSSSTAAMSSAVTTGLQGIQTASDATFASIEPAAQGAYNDMTTTFDGATGYFQDLWTTVTDTFSANGDIAQGLAVGMGIIMNSSVNKMIDAINTYAIDPLIKLSNAVELIKSFSFGGLKPFAGLPKLNFFRIPKLAQGAVLPPNQPFLSMVGDQKRGTNVEAPLETIKQAVAEVMMENNDLLTAGFEAVVRAIQNKDMSVRIGDKDIYDANSNYEKRLNIMRGTV